jgi:hypothetical protein
MIAPDSVCSNVSSQCHHLRRLWTLNMKGVRQKPMQDDFMLT